MNPKPTQEDFATIRRLVDGVAMHRSLVVRGRPIFAWTKLSKEAIAVVDSASRAETLDSEHLDRVLEARTLSMNARRK